MPIDTIFMRRIRLDASIGVFPWEHQLRQPIEVDVEAEVDTSIVLNTHNLSDGLDFTVVANAVRDVVEQGHVELVEVIADRIAARLLASTQALRVVVEVRKYVPFASLADNVGVRVQRGREGALARPSPQHQAG
jgi:7,8-dihydroneopterin aldolase/epimerase/oxygenase